MRAYSLAIAQDLHVRKDIHWRVYTACWAAATARHLGGDFIECGVFKGFVSRIVMQYIGFQNLPRKFYLRDTFEGLVGECLTNAERQRGRTAGGYGVSFDFVKQVFAAFPNAVLVKGMVPGTLSQIASDKVAYVHLDMNCMAPETAAAEYLQAASGQERHDSSRRLRLARLRGTETRLRQVRQGARCRSALAAHRPGIDRQTLLSRVRQKPCLRNSKADTTHGHCAV